MKISPEKILKHAESRLQFLPDRGNQGWIELFKKFLKIENHRLLMSHRFGAEGLQVARDRSYFMDVLIQHIFSLAVKENPTPASAKGFAMVALGGYGRQELNPCSDIDILFLISKKDEALDQVIKRVLYLLWDIGLKVGQSVRNLSEAVEEGKKDFKSRTSMMEARFLCGDKLYFEEFQKNFKQKCSSKDVQSYVEQKLEEIKSRHERFRDTVYLQEPNIKDGVGGLRDLSSCIWLYQSISGYSSFKELHENGILSQEDFKIVGRVLNFLHRVRNELHFITEKCFDVLTLPLQGKVAKNLGYQDTRIMKSSEAFMKDYYEHARNADQLTQGILAREEIQSQLKIRFPSKFVDRHGFAFTAEEILPGKDPNIFYENPSKLFEIFLYCVHGHYRLSQGLVQQIRHHLYLVTKQVQSSPQVRDIFIGIMKFEGRMGSALRAMHDTGLLGKYLPEWGKATCFVQHDFYHKYTLDEHTLKAIVYMDELKTTQDPRLLGFTGVLKEMESLDVAFLGIFFHDIGKVQGKDHSIKGVKIVDDIFRRIQYDPVKTHRIKVLVEHHLLMVHLSQRRDLSEEKVIIDFAQKIEDVENLRALLLLTYADSRATADDLWNEWKEALLWEMYFRTKRYLEEKVILLPSEIQAMKDSYAEVISKKGIPEETVRQHLNMLPINYLQSYRVETVLEHLKIISEIEKYDPKILWEYNEKTNTTEMTLCTKDHIGLFAEVTGVIASQYVNILGANIFSRKDGIVIDKFFLENRPEKSILPPRTRQKIEEELQEIIQKKKKIQDLLKDAHAPTSSYRPEHQKTVIKFDNETSLASTVLEIQSDDQVGFLYKLTRTLSKIGININLAKIATEKAQIYDVFYISDFEGKKIDRPDVQEVIKEEIFKAIESPLENI
jgi:[protein-PII] uridylyltransferase